MTCDKTSHSIHIIRWGKLFNWRSQQANTKHKVTKLRMDCLPEIHLILLYRTWTLISHRYSAIYGG